MQREENEHIRATGAKLMMPMLAMAATTMAMSPFFC
jgi:hypothetical protein